MMKSHPSLCGLLCTAALWAPLPAAADSETRAGAAGRVSASAHVDFKIVIPRVLSLTVIQAGDGMGAAQAVAIGSNGRNVALAATVRGAGSPRHDAVLGAPLRSNIAQQASCAPGIVTPVASSPAVVCTVSMP